MRLVSTLALTTAALALASVAQAGDRYGPPPARRPLATAAPAQPGAAPTPISYNGPLLNWAGKRPAQAPVQPAAPGAPQRIPGGLYRGQPGVPTPPVAPAPPPAPYAPAALPDSLYAPVRAAPSAPVAPAPPVAPVAPAAPVATLPPPPSPQRLAASSPYASSTPRAYSVIREYGGTPDPIPAPAYAGSPAFRPETSLTTPLDDPKPKPKDRTAQAGDPDWGASDDPGLSEGTP